jgi:penicillin-binding protein 1A
MGIWGRSKMAREVPAEEPEQVEYLSYGPLYDEEEPGDPEFGAWLDETLGLKPENEEGGGPESTAAPGKRTRWWWSKRVLLGMLAAFLLLLAWLAITAPLSKSLQPIVPPQITLLAADGTPIARNGAVVDMPVDVQELPPHVVQAFLAIEDRRFYSHWGVDPRGVVRAAWTGVGGGSTITQQLAKFTFLTPERSLTRKAREAMIAYWLEAWLSKDEILERYLSNAYFGDNVYGLRAASLHYFYRRPENLKLEQAAMLAGLLQAPSRLAPTRNPEAAERRMRLVLNSMVEAGYITEAEARAAPTPELDVRTRNELPTGTYFADWALPEARRLSEVGYARQTLATTLDSRLQDAARRAIDRAALGNAQVALVAMRPNGEVVAMVGGRDYGQSTFNRATQARRQPGSTFKPFVYAAAIASGRYTAASLVNDAPDVYDLWKPKNYGSCCEGPVRLRHALAKSINTVAIRVCHDLGPPVVAQLARAMGIESTLPEHLSLSLGSGEVTPLELTNAFATFAAGGVVQPPRMVEAIDGKATEPGPAAQALPAEVAHVVVDMMRSVLEPGGTGAGARKDLKVTVAGKTGTSNDERDAWFVGITPEYAIGVWIGHDDNRPLGAKQTGGSLALPVFVEVVKALGPRPRKFDRPVGVVEARVDKATGLLAAPGAPGDASYVEVFVAGSVPVEVAAAPGEVDTSTFITDEYGDGAPPADAEPPAAGP